MAKKTKKNIKKKTKKAPNKELANKIRYLDILIEYSLKPVKKDGSVLDSIFKVQANRLFEEQKKLKENQ